MTETTVFKGRPALAGDVEGPAEVSHVGFITAASYIELVTKGSKSGVCTDHDNKDLFGRDLAGTILCLPQTIGSSSGACMFMAILEKECAPKAMLFANHIDSHHRIIGKANRQAGAFGSAGTSATTSASRQRAATKRRWRAFMSEKP